MEQDEINKEILDEVRTSTELARRLESAVDANTAATENMVHATQRVATSLKLQALLPASVMVMGASSWFFHVGKLQSYEWLFCVALAISPYFPLADLIAGKIVGLLPGPKTIVKMLLILSLPQLFVLLGLLVRL